MRKTIGDIISIKGPDVLTVDAGATVLQALEKMAEYNIGALVVTRQGTIVGMLSERDYTRKVLIQGRSSPTTSVEEIMSTQVCYITPDMGVEDGLALMTEKRCRHLPVMDNEQMVGLVSIGDLVKAQIEEKEFIIEQLENYITVGR